MPNATTAQIFKTIKKYKSFLVSTHVNPDPDAISSELAIAELLRKLGKKVYVVNEQKVPERLAFMPQTKLVRSLKECSKIDFDAVIVVDCGDLERIGDVAKLISKNHFVINIDHHVTNASFGDMNLVLPDASSTAEIIFDIFQSVRIPLTQDTAGLLYLGIMTDTGSFRYENTTGKTHQAVGYLLEKFDIPIGQYFQKLYEGIPLADFKQMTHVLDSFESFLHGKVICLELSKQKIKNFSNNLDLRDIFFKYLRSIREVEVIVIFTEVSPKQTRLNFRSQNYFDVAKLSSKFGGGGHKRASGGMIDCDMKKAKAVILKEIKRTIS